MQLRSFSTFNLPFSFGFYLMLVILIGLPMSMADPKRLRSKIFFLTLPILSIGLLLSFVRGAMLGLAIGLLYLAFTRYKILVYGIPIVLVAALFIPSGANVSTAVFSSTSFQARTVSWGDRIDLFAENPVFGTGIGTTGAAAEKAATINNQDPNATYYPDNSWLKVAFELGIFGLWLLVIMLVSIFLFTRSVGRKVSGIDQDFVSGVAAQLLAIMVGALVATYLELSPMDQLFWVMITIVATMAPEIAPGPAVQPPGPPLPLDPLHTLSTWRPACRRSPNPVEHWDTVYEGRAPGVLPDDDAVGLAALAHFGPIEGARLLDLGCGTGEYSRFFAKHGAMVIAVDRSEVAVSTLRDRCVADGITTIEAGRGRGVRPRVARPVRLRVRLDDPAPHRAVRRLRRRPGRHARRRRAGVLLREQRGEPVPRLVPRATSSAGSGSRRTATTTSSRSSPARSTCSGGGST